MGTEQQPPPHLPPRPPPLLMTLHGDHSKKQSLYNILENRHQTMSLQMLCNRRVLGSTEGWLAVVDPSPDEGDCFIWNPKTLQIFDLQDLVKPYTYDRCFISKPPTEPGCIVVFSQRHSQIKTFHHIENGFVSTFDLDPREEGYKILAMAYFRGVVYGIHYPAHEFVAVEYDGDEFGLKALCVEPFEIPEPTRSWAAVNTHYLMESPCGNELILVIKMCFTVYQRHVVQFRVFRVDVVGMECEELDNLDGRTVFINFYGNGFCCYAESRVGARMKPNSIYYTNESSGKLIFVYDIDDGSSVTLSPCRDDADVDPDTSENYWVDISAEIHSCGGLV